VSGARVVLVTAPSPDAGAALGRVLVDERLAACVNVIPGLTSIYRWQGEREEASECLLVIKTDETRYAELERRVLELHPYTVPEVLALPVERGAPAYMEWLKDSVAIEGR
jgi:periplasmic divalent cation tolerance protein